jgi:hypothetical protein
MGTKSKPPVEIELSNRCNTEVFPPSGLPPFRTHIDVHSSKRGQKALTRLFLAEPTNEDLADTVQLKQLRPELIVIGACMPYMAGPKTDSTLFNKCKALGLRDDFAKELIRLVISHLQGKQLGHSSLNSLSRALRLLVEFLAGCSPKPVSLTDLHKDIWLAFLKKMEASEFKSAKLVFTSARIPFTGYEPTSHHGWLANIPFRDNRRTKILPEHTSELALTSDYSDVVMYQLLALFVYQFELRIEYLRRYERISEANMPKEWLYPGRKPVRVNGNCFDTTQLVRQWLRDGDVAHELIIDHFLLHHKTGMIRKNSRGALQGGIAKIMQRLRYESSDAPLAYKFNLEMGRRHGYVPGVASISLLNFYVKKKSPAEPNSVINQIGWCLANLVMMQTGVNKEVILTIPSKAEDGSSILTRGDTVFVKQDGSETEINMYGIKSKTGNSPMKVIPVIVVKNSPLYEMLVEYEKHVKVGNGPFFEFDKHFINDWNTAAQSTGNLSKIYPVIDEGGQQLSSINTQKFRKVFVSGQLLDRMKNIKDMNELAEKLRDDMSHNRLDITLSNYLLKSTVGRSVIDIAIATILGGKLNDLKCKSHIEGNKTIPFKKKVFLCHCVDPQYPSHDVAIADECKHYDLCLGCDQSIITKVHLPYICLRILQYEAARENNPHFWPALFEDKWCIAHDALSRYSEKNKKNGRSLVEEAWNTARQGRVTLPPIITPNLK